MAAIELPEELARRVMPVAYAYPDVYARLVEFYAEDAPYSLFRSVYEQQASLLKVLGSIRQLDWYTDPGTLSRVYDWVNRYDSRGKWVLDNQPSLGGIIDYKPTLDWYVQNVDAISRLPGRLSSAESNISSLGSRLGTAETSLSDVSGFLTSTRRTNIDYIPSLGSRLDTVEGWKGRVDDIPDLRYWVDNLKPRVSSAESRLDDVSGFLTSLDSRIGELESWLSDTRKGYVDYVPTLSSRVSSAESGLHGILADPAFWVWYYLPKELQGLVSDPPKYISDRLSTRLKIVEGIQPTLSSFVDGTLARIVLGMENEIAIGADGMRFWKPNYAPYSFRWGVGRQWGTWAELMSLDNWGSLSIAGHLALARDRLLALGNAHLNESGLYWLNTIRDRVLYSMDLLDSISINVNYDFWIGFQHFYTQPATITYAGRDGVTRWLSDIATMSGGTTLWPGQASPQVEAVLFLGFGMQEIVKSLLRILGMFLP